MTGKFCDILVQQTEDIYALRQGGRLAAAALGCDEPDQVRLATALSELGREVIARKSATHAAFSLLGDGSVAIEMRPFPPSATAAIDAARKLLGEVDVRDDGSGSFVVLHTRSLAHRQRPTEADLRTAVSAARSQRPLDELRLENHDLIMTLDRLKEKQEDLIRLNGELEETNRGVMAMYSRLSEELEETNRGVVALYAELDDKTVLLKTASEAKTRFLASVTHELRSPLHSILGLAGFLCDPLDPSITPEQRRQAELIRGSADELLKLINGLLDISKVESGKLEAEITLVAVDELLTDLRGSLRPLVPPGIDFIVKTCQDEAVLETDPVLLGQVLRNLVTNALKFTLNGSVTLSCSRPDSYTIAFTVADTGVGIAPEHQARVFEEFYQVRSSTQNGIKKGSGLGLPYAKRVAEFLGGEMTLESSPGQGSTFTVTLPMAWRPLSYGAATVGIEGVRVGKALIIDDDPALRTALRGMLQGVANQVYEAANGTDGLERMDDLRPDILFLDLRLPDLDGSDVLAEIRRRPEVRDTPVVIVTSAEIGRDEFAGTVLLAKSTLDRHSLGRAIVEARSASAARG